MKNLHSDREQGMPQRVFLHEDDCMVAYKLQNGDIKCREDSRGSLERYCVCKKYKQEDERRAEAARPKR